MEDKQSQNNKRSILIRYFKAQEKEIPEAEIEARWDKLMRKVKEDERRRLHRFRLYAAAVCTAAMLSGIVWLAFPDMKQKAADERWHSAIAELDRHRTDTSKQIVLLTEAQKQIEIDKGAVVSYSSKGEISINKEKLEKETTDKQKKVEESVEYNQLIVPKGKYSRLILADGSSLYVNAGTKVVYPNRFDDKKREIYVDGEIFIDVKRDEKRPFVVKTASCDIQVLGTAFNVNAYKERGEAEVVLLRGAVSVTDMNHETLKMSPDELVSLSDGKVVEKRTVDASTYVDWTQGRLLLSGKGIKNILYKLSLFYGVNIDFDTAVESLQLHGTIDLSVPLERVLDRIGKTVPLGYEKNENGYHIYQKQNVELKNRMPMEKDK